MPPLIDVVHNNATVEYKLQAMSQSLYISLFSQR